MTCCEPANSAHTPCGLTVAAIRFGATEAEVGLRRLGRYFAWGAFGLLSPVLTGEELVEEDPSAMATALCRGFGLVASYVGSRRAPPTRGLLAVEPVDCVPRPLESGTLGTILGVEESRTP